jgi:hypothetical protein
MNEFMPPPNAHAYFAWEDPPLVCDYRDWSMFSDMDNFMLQVKTLWSNIARLLMMQQYTGYFHLAGFILLIAGVLFARKNGWRMKSLHEIVRDPLFLFIPFILTYTAGYLLIFIEPRYVWIGYALITIGSFVSLHRLLPVWKLNKKAVLPAVSVAMLAVLVLIVFKEPRALAPLKRFFNKEVGQHYTYDFYQSTQQIRTIVPEGTHMANWGMDGRRERTQSSSLACFMRGRHYGQLPADEATTIQLLEQYRIDLVIFTKENKERPAFLNAGWTQVLPSPGELVLFRRTGSPAR